MEKETIAFVTSGLFLFKDTCVRKPILVTELPPPVTLEGREIGIERIRNKKKASGLEGINITILVALHQMRST